ncbi:Zinc dependent phospholipase C [Lachnospiraceae bacterium XBB1006]|nr:Zinc dependent phospholipase C [Lachnospiraceae bacterium XBB1006]
MKKRTHYALSRQLLKDNRHEFGYIESALYCFGSIFPDCSPLCLIRPHMFTVTNHKTKKRMVKLISGRYNHYADCFRLGCLSHHVADYFTAPHNRMGMAGFCMDHRGYEMRLHDYFKESLKEEGAHSHAVSMSTISFWKNMELKHEDYLDAIAKEESIETDYEFIMEQMTTLFWLFAEQRQVAYA